MKKKTNLKNQKKLYFNIFILFRINLRSIFLQSINLYFTIILKKIKNLNYI